MTMAPRFRLFAVKKFTDPRGREPILSGVMEKFWGATVSRACGNIVLAVVDFFECLRLFFKVCQSI